MTTSPWWHRVGWTALLVLALLPPHVFGSYVLYVLNLVGIYVILALGLNLLTGFTGQISLGHAGFFGIGAYASTLLVTAGWSFWLAWPVGGVFAGAFGLLVGLPALRIGGHYLALVTFAFGRITQLVLGRWESLTNGFNGLNVPRPRFAWWQLDTDARMYYLVLPTAALLVLATRNIVASRIGRAFIAIRDSHLAGAMMGIHVAAFKALAFTVSAFYAGIAGGLFGVLTGFISPDIFGLFESALYLMMIILGGLGSVPGSILGAAFMVILPEALRPFKEYQELLYGVMFVLVLMFLPKGIAGLFDNLAGRVSTFGFRSVPRPTGPQLVDTKEG